MRVYPEGQEKNTSVPINVSLVLGFTLSLRSSFGQILFVTKTCNLFMYPLCVVQVNNPESWNAQIYRIFKLLNSLYLYHGTWQVQSVVPIHLLIICSPAWILISTLFEHQIVPFTYQLVIPCLHWTRSTQEFLSSYYRYSPTQHWPLVEL